MNRIAFLSYNLSLNWQSHDKELCIQFTTASYTYFLTFKNAITPQNIAENCNNALFNALYFLAKSARTLTHFIFTMNVRNNYGRMYTPSTECCLVLLKIWDMRPDHRLLRSATSRTCVVRRTYSNYGDRCFAAAGSRLWNSLPTDLRQADISFEQFKRLLKTFLFGCWDRGALWLTVNPRLINSLTYLLMIKELWA